MIAVRLAAIEDAEPTAQLEAILYRRRRSIAAGRHTKKMLARESSKVPRLAATSCHLTDQWCRRSFRIVFKAPHARRQHPDALPALLEGPVRLPCWLP